MISSSLRFSRPFAAFASLVVLSLVLLSSPRPVAATDSLISVGISASPRSVVFGGSTKLGVRVVDAASGELDGASLSVQRALFPYRKFTNVRTFRPVQVRSEVRVKPAFNTRYRAVLTLADGNQFLSLFSTVYVNPVRSGNRYVNTSSGVRYIAAKETYSRQLLKRWKKVPPRLRTIYFYQRCDGSRDYILRGKKRAKTRLNGPRMTLLFPGFIFQDSACGQRSYRLQVIGTSKFPGYLGNGDDGGGAPTSTVRQYKLWTKVAGNKRISKGTMRQMGFP